MDKHYMTHPVEIFEADSPPVRPVEKTGKTWEDLLLAGLPEGEGVEKETTRVVLAEDHPRVRAGIRSLLESTPDISVIGEASNGVQALTLVETLTPDVLVLDMEMPLLDGVQVATRLNQIDSSVQILVLSAHDDRQFIMGMLNKGAAGYLTKDEVPEALIKAVREIARGEQGWVSQRVAEKLAEWKAHRALDRPTLTHREVDVLRLLADQKENPEIAERLGISEHIVERHIEILCMKLNAFTRSELCKKAVEEGILEG